MADRFPRSLKDAIHAGKLIPFAGAGVSMSVRCVGNDRPAYPGWKDLLLAAADELDSEQIAVQATAVRRHINSTEPNFFLAAEAAYTGLGVNGWVKLLRRNFELDHATIDQSSLELARAVWALAHNLVMTTNFDFTLRWACPNPQNLREWGLEDPSGYIQLLEPAIDRPAIWHIHGTIQKPTDLILALGGYEQLYAPFKEFTSRYDAALETLRNVLTTRVLLFIGFSFADDYFSKEIERVATLYRGAGPKHYVLVRQAEEQNLVSLLESRGIRNVQSIVYEDYGTPLVEMVMALSRFRHLPGSSNTDHGDADVQGTGPSPANKFDPGPGIDRKLEAAQADVRGDPDLEAAELEVLLLVGSWQPMREGDREIVRSLGADPAGLERVCTRLLSKDNSPVRYDVDRRRGGQCFTWVDPERVWPALVSKVTATLLRQFENAAIEVLGEVDPALTLEPEQRFMAAIHRKVRRFSDCVREGIAASLARLSEHDPVLKAIHGTSRGSLLAHRVAHEVLKPDWQSWASLDRLLPYLAEAAPSTFLERLEGSLSIGRAGVPAVFSQETSLGGNVHVGLLWALETLAWRTDLLPRVATVLGRLAAHDQGGTLANRPKASLKSVLHPMLPQSVSTPRERVAILLALFEREFDVAWTVTKELFETAMTGMGLVFTSRRPEIAKWPLPAETSATSSDAGDQLQSMLRLLRERAGRADDRWADLLDMALRLPTGMANELLDSLSEQDLPVHHQVWAKLRELLYDAYRFGENWGTDQDLVRRLEELYRKLAPSQFVARVAWLFSSGPTHLPERIAGDWQAEEARLDALRAESLAELWRLEDRWDQLAKLALATEGGWKLGTALADASFADEIEERVVKESDPLLHDALPSFLVRRLERRSFAGMEVLAEALLQTGRVAELATTLASLPATPELWKLVERCGDPLRTEYWKNFRGLQPDSPAEYLGTAVDALLAVGQVGQAVTVAARAHERLPAQLALKILQRLVQSTDASRAVSRTYEIEQLFKAVDRRDASVPDSAVIQVEIPLLRLLEHTSRGPAVLFHALASQPEFFSSLLHAMYSSSHGEETEKPDRHVAQAAYFIVDAWKGYPGENLPAEERERFLAEWCTSVLTSANEECKGPTAYEVGRVLARVPAGPDGEWPCQTARELLKANVSPDIAKGLFITKRNSRGATLRRVGEGGDQERSLASKFRETAVAVRVMWPETAAVLDRLADSYEVDAEREDAEAAADRHRYATDSKPTENT